MSTPRIAQKVKELANEHAHKCFPYNASGNAAAHAVHITNQTDSFLKGAQAGERIGYLRGRIEMAKELFQNGCIGSHERYFALKEAYESELVDLLQEVPHE